MAIVLAEDDFKRLKQILSQTPDFFIDANRVGFLLGMLQSSPRQSDILGSYTISGPGDGAAVRLIHWLCTFGKDTPDRESLALLVNALLDKRGETSEDGIFLRSLVKRYPLYADRPTDPANIAQIASSPVLTPRQQDALQRALLQAFNFRSLERLLWYKLGKDLEHIRLGHSDLQDVVFHLLKSAESEGWLHDLINAAAAANPGNAQLKAFVDSIAA